MGIDIASSDVPPGTYQHYSGKKYEVLGLAKHTESGEKLVAYRPLYDCPDLEATYGIRPLFVRPASMFIELVNIDGQTLPRFRQLK